MRPVRWLFIYCTLWTIVTLFTGLLLHNFNLASPPKSMEFIKNEEPLHSIISIFGSDEASFLIGATIMILSPILGLLAVIFMSASSGDIFASFLAGYCPLSHIVYDALESISYICLWYLALRIHYMQHTKGIMEEKWETSLRWTFQLVALSSVTFLLLAVTEVFEVEMFG